MNRRIPRNAPVSGHVVGYTMLPSQNIELHCNGWQVHKFPDGTRMWRPQPTPLCPQCSRKDV